MNSTERPRLQVCLTSEGLLLNIEVDPILKTINAYYVISCIKMCGSFTYGLGPRFYPSLR